MKFINIILLFFCLQTIISAQNTEGGITFIHDQFSETLARAKKENKLVFMDAYTTWCGPCKMMSKSTFTDTGVSALFNQKFVNLKMDMEKGEGPSLQQRYGIVAYPTLLFLNAAGEVVHKALGYHDAAQFLNLGQTALNGEETLGKWMIRYERGERDPAFLKAYAEILAQAFETHRFKVADEYLATQTDWKTPENLAFIYKFTEGVDSKLFSFLVNNQKDFTPQFTKEEVSLKIQEIAMAYLYAENNLPTLSAADSVLRLVYPSIQFDKMSLGYRLQYYRLKGDRPNYAKSAVTYLKKYDDSYEALNENAVTFYEQIDDKKLLKKAVKWAKKSVTLDNRFVNQIVVAQLYSKLGKKSRAKKEAQKAIAIAKKAGDGFDEATDLIAELEEKK